MSKTPATAQELYDILGPLQAKKGYYFNHERDMTMPLLEQLLAIRKEYGYMACPCRLANGEYEKDKDIVCPCVYRADDVAEFGTCYCGLYVSAEWNDKKTAFRAIPDRRPPENITF
ncbi:FtrB [uncultured delta proteobacterium]|uniref:ferredoxin:thioredoxin reductase n=1 Tax=uncultured delta proteobacterium TaxID=34034 RepID=A0A212JG09_9DELT|nr:FtrB [uncultured delta proteobacterium]